MRRTSYSRLVLAMLAVVLAGLGAFAVHSQSEEFTDARADAEFHFARMIYRDQRGGGRGRYFGGGMGRGWWMQDWPDAETHFRQGILRLTKIDAGAAVEVDLQDGRVFDYPWLYATQA